MKPRGGEDANGEVPFDSEESSFAVDLGDSDSDGSGGESELEEHSQVCRPFLRTFLSSETA